MKISAGFLLGVVLATVVVGLGGSPLVLKEDPVTSSVKTTVSPDFWFRCADDLFHRLSFNGSHPTGFAIPTFLNSLEDGEARARMLLEGARFVTLANEAEHSTLACCALTLKLTLRELGLDAILLYPNEISVTTCLPCLRTHSNIAAWCLDGPKLQSKSCGTTTYDTVQVILYHDDYVLLRSLCVPAQCVPSSHVVPYSTCMMRGNPENP
uniref:uncharacterized protein n=1 Tax=Myxine glutinosa TaxID=7769 RepID=UPI003590068C